MKMGYGLKAETMTEGFVNPLEIITNDMSYESEETAFFDKQETNEATQELTKSAAYKQALADYKKFEQNRPLQRSEKYSFNQNEPGADVIPEAKAWRRSAQKLLVKIIGNNTGPWRLEHYNNANDVDSQMWATSGNLIYLEH